MGVRNDTLLMEIRPGTGGDEATLFAADLLRMYQKFAEKKKWLFKIQESDKTTLGGVKHAIIKITGEDVGLLQHEGGVHRVQRVPETEKSGRIHTSTATVAILPQVKELQEIQLNPADLKIDTYRASGAGGQHVNVTDSAIRITHLPTGAVVTCQDERSQHKNRQKAIQQLKAKLIQFKKAQGVQKVSDLRKSQVKDAERSDKIRTYNFPQNRVTDHRINKSWQNLDKIIEGNLKKMTQTLNKKMVQNNS
jgi:peptide chain release factor 1